MASLAEQLQRVKLKKVDKTSEVKDFSDPKLAGYTSPEEIHAYQRSVLEVNTERWMDILQEHTFPTKYCPLTIQHAKLFMKIYEDLYKDKDPEKISEINWHSCLSSDELSIMDALETSLQHVMNEFLTKGDFVFVKTSSRSAKDAPMYGKKFRELYLHELEKVVPVEKRNAENEQITCLLAAAFAAMRMSDASEVLSMLASSERIYQDMMLAVDHIDCFQENLVVRQFVDIDVDMEFRGFVHGYDLTALSQYNYLIFSPKLLEQKDQLCQSICKFYSNIIKPKVEQSGFVDKFIIDFAVCTDKETNQQRIWVIEINPFLETTDGALFSWQHERKILEGGESGQEFVLRITERPKPGAKTMLPYSVRKLLEEKNN